MKKYKVLIFPCGSENAIEIYTALKDCINIILYGASGKEDHGAFIFKNYFGGIPFIHDSDFTSRINEIIDKNSIDIIFPTHDSVSLFFAENQSAIHCRVAVPEVETARICRYKNLTYQLFSDQPFCPRLYFDESDIIFPCFIKPIEGQGGKNAHTLFSVGELRQFKWENDFIVSEFLPGEEYTVDCFTNRKGTLLFAGPRKRNRIFGGISTNSFVVESTEEIRRIATEINSRLSFRGLWFFQVKQDQSQQLKLLEVSCRASGTMNLYRNLGINFPLITVYDAFDHEVEIIRNHYYLEVDRALFNRYKTNLDYDTVYIDFDDTILKDGKVNPFVVFFLYGEKNKGKNIIMITRHERNINQTLIELNISPGLFDKIHHISDQQLKAEFIDISQRPIFIDNAFKERYEVKKKLNIPVFDIDAIQSLIDWRE